jgi:hypothetical protein
VVFASVDALMLHLKKKVKPAISYLNRLWISIYRATFQPMGEILPTTAPLANSGDFCALS